MYTPSSTSFEDGTDEEKGEAEVVVVDGEEDRDG